MSRVAVPPGESSRLQSVRTLVLAPHFDDEVLGCGGLLAGLARAGTQITVAFLSDGSGGVEDVGDRRAYATRRRAEAEAASKVLGVGVLEYLDLLDGSLASSLKELKEAIERLLAEVRPDLLLVPTPLEVTTDHQAPFAALHQVLSPLRSGDALLEAVAGLGVLLYEVNHPAHPDTLVDVTEEQETLEEAMACYGSQEERHNYLAAGLGLRRYRSVTLGPEVTLAEAYTRLEISDLSTRSLAQLIGDLGGAPPRVEVPGGPLVSVVVRTRNRPVLLAQALESLAGSTYRNVEVILVNDGGEPPAEPGSFPFPLRRVDLGGDGGQRAAAANAGIHEARGDYLAFLDDDDLAAPEHLATLVGLAEGSGARVVYTDAAVGIYEAAADGGWSCSERRLPYSRDFDADLLLFDNYIPFNTLLMERSLLLEVGALDEELPIFEDWDYLIRLSRLCEFHHLARVTCEYRHFRGGRHALGEQAAARSDFVEMKARVIDKHRSSLEGPTLARVVVALRREAVEARTRADDLNSRLTTLSTRFQLVNGELEAVRGSSAQQAVALAEHEAALAEHVVQFQRMFDEESRLRSGLDDQIEHLGRTYAEIERLGAEMHEMKTTRAWRFHAWWQRRRS